MQDGKKTVYKVFRFIAGRRFPYAEIYTDGTFKSVGELERKAGRTESTEETWRRKIASYIPPTLECELGGYRNPNYPEAFSALVVITGRTPPYKKWTGYLVEYLGGGAPWEKTNSEIIP